MFFKIMAKRIIKKKTCPHRVIIPITPLANGDEYPYTMINILTDKGFKKEWGDSISSINNLEQEIFELVDKYNIESDEEDDLRKIFHYIQIWAGYSAMHYYIDKEKPFDWDAIKDAYKALVKSCLSISELSEETYNSIGKAIREFMEKTKMTIPFITKHTRFWSSKKLKANMLPIYDSNMANVFGKKTVKQEDLTDYWKWIVNKKTEKETLANLERRLFEEERSKRKSKDEEIKKQKKEAWKKYNEE